MVDPTEAAGRRVALVIGNSAYEAVPRLANPVNDAEAVGESLRSIGFELTQVADADRAGMIRALQDFEIVAGDVVRVEADKPG